MFICAFITQAKTKEEAWHPQTESRLLENMTKDPISEFFLNQKNPDICSGAAAYISSEEIFSFSNDNDSRGSLLCNRLGLPPLLDYIKEGRGP